MKIRLKFLNVYLVAVLLAACSPARTQPGTPSVEANQLPTAAAPLESAPGPLVTLEAPTPTPFPVATSRGPNLEATDPSTVTLASGGLQLIEFFRFT